MTKIRCTDTFHGGVQYFNRQRQAKLNILTEFTGNVVSQRDLILIEILKYLFRLE